MEQVRTDGIGVFITCTSKCSCVYAHMNTCTHTCTYYRLRLTSLILVGVSPPSCIQTFNTHTHTHTHNHLTACPTHITSIASPFLHPGGCYEGSPDVVTQEGAIGDLMCDAMSEDSTLPTSTSTSDASCHRTNGYSAVNITFVVTKSERFEVFLVTCTMVIAMVMPMTPPPPSRCTCTVCGTDGSSNYCCLWPY